MNYNTILFNEDRAHRTGELSLLFSLLCLDIDTMKWLSWAMPDVRNNLAQGMDAQQLAQSWYCV